MKVGFTGTQEGLSQLQRVLLVCELIELQPTEVHHGMCIGSDTNFHDVVVQLINDNYISKDCKIIGHPPINKNKCVIRDCDEYRKDKDYLVRNKEIVNESDVLIATPLTNEEILRSGTWSTIRFARKQNKKVIILER